MPDMLHDGLAWLAAQLTTFYSQTVTYTRPGLGSCALQATIGRTAFRTGDDRNTRLEWADVDFLIDASLLVIGAQTITPKTGDRIAWNARVYEVQPFNGEQPFRPSDPFAIKLRIHTKRVQ
jgi:hypothetical protein